MKPPWYQHAADAELEALQTDVMRFIAILGLCLAAIFSLVHTNSQNLEAVLPVAAETVQELPSRPAHDSGSAPATPEIARRKPIAIPEPSAVVPTPAAQKIGFSLEFVSAAALLGLLESGQLRLYAKVDGQFWVLDSDGGSFSGAATPDSYYRMLADTVPATLRQKLTRVAAAGPGEWGVQLTPQMVEQLQRIMQQRSGGNLLIQSDGSIHVGPAEKDSAASLHPLQRD